MSLCTLMMPAKVEKKTWVGRALRGVDTPMGASTSSAALPAAVLARLHSIVILVKKLTIGENDDE
jgi:hypothetical protein